MLQMVFLFLMLQGADKEQEQCCFVETAAKIIKNAIKELHVNNDSCSSPNGVESSEKMLNIFLNLFISFWISCLLGRKDLFLYLLGKS